MTLTTGSSIRGYSRTDRRVYEMRPISRMSSDSTVAKTGPLDADLGQLHDAACPALHGLRRAARAAVGLGRQAACRLIRRPLAGRRGSRAAHRRSACAAPATLHRRAVAQLQLAGGDDDVVRPHALDDLDLAVAALPDLDLRRAPPCRRRP